MEEGLRRDAGSIRPARARYLRKQEKRETPTLDGGSPPGDSGEH